MGWLFDFLNYFVKRDPSPYMQDTYVGEAAAVGKILMGGRYGTATFPTHPQLNRKVHPLDTFRISPIFSSRQHIAASLSHFYLHKTKRKMALWIGFWLLTIGLHGGQYVGLELGCIRYLEG